MNNGLITLRVFLVIDFNREGGVRMPHVQTRGWSIRKRWEEATGAGWNSETGSASASVIIRVSITPFTTFRSGIYPRDMTYFGNRNRMWFVALPAKL
jgi:hypothetical protein